MKTNKKLPQIDWQANYLNRELSWLHFNDRVLEIAINRNIPSLERGKFLAIFSTNLDEFFMVRIATLLRRVELNDENPDSSGLTPAAQLHHAMEFIQILEEKRDKNWQRSLLPTFKKYNIEFVAYNELDKEQSDFVYNFFKEKVFPVTLPMACDLGHPFPVLQGKQLYFAVHSYFSDDKKKKKPFFSIVPLPTRVLPRIVRLPSENGTWQFIMLEDIVKAHLEEFYVGNDVQDVGLFRVIRDAEFSLEEVDAEDLRQLVESQLKSRIKGNVVRLQTERGFSEKLLQRLKKEFSIGDDRISHSNVHIDLSFLMQLYGSVNLDTLKEKSYPGVLPNWVKGDMFQAIAKKDRFLHHPYHVYDPVVKLLDAAAEDPGVLAIKQVLYRVSSDSPIVKALIRAAENGKQVSVLLEIYARFDEATNIGYASQLEKAGCHVIYGVVGLKTHAKALLIIRKEVSGIKRYAHLATGNYNEKTARLYTDCSIMTAKEDFTEDVSHLFNVITGYSRPMQWRRVGVAPINLKNKVIDLIENEILKSRKAMPGHIFAKMNSLLDKDVIDALYKASQNHVKVDLVVRGICALRPGIPGFSENITVKSIIGRYLEHPRIFRFKNGNNQLYFISSADWMPRNLLKRIEVLVPVEDRDNRRYLDEIIQYNLNDNTNSWQLSENGEYTKTKKKSIDDTVDLFIDQHQLYIKRKK